MRAIKKFMTAVLIVVMLAGTMLPVCAEETGGFNAGLNIDRETEGQISVTVAESSVLSSKKPTLTIDCDYTYAKVKNPDSTVSYYTIKSGKLSLKVFMGGTYVIEPVSKIPENKGNKQQSSVKLDETTATKENEDGSVTETTENTKTGTVTTTTTAPDGTKTTTVTDKNKNVTQLSAEVSEEAAKSGKTVTLPLEVPVADKGESSAKISITLPESAGKVTVEIPADKPAYGLVAKSVSSDGTETVIKTTRMTDRGVAVELTGSAVIKLVDNSKNFKDVPNSAWYKNAADFVSARELFGGVSGTEPVFDGNGSMTRAMMVVVLCRLADGHASGTEITFSDVTPKSWYAEAAQWAVENGIAKGYDGAFWPTYKLTREQLAVMLYRLSGGHDVSGELSAFKDGASVSSWAKDAMIWAVEKGIILGDGNGYLNPRGYATRAEVAAMIMRLY